MRKHVFLLILRRSSEVSATLDLLRIASLVPLLHVAVVVAFAKTHHIQWRVDLVLYLTRRGQRDRLLLLFLNRR